MGQEKLPRHKRVIVAMSGGVDSSVTALLLKESGFQVEGMTMPLTGFNAPEVGQEEHGPVERASRVCEVLGIPHHTVHPDPAVQQQVVSYFVNEYLKGRTPNPCIQCNTTVKFKALFDKAIELGADFMATGHYARIDCEKDGKCYLKKGIDQSKDQSYFLYGIGADILPQILFPLGEMTKQQVRQFALDKQLPCASQRDSQDICFVPQGDYKELLRQRAGREAFIPGPFKNHEGKVVGEHLGIGFYTIGQRDGLGIALGYPAYVYRISPEENTIYVGPRECLLSDGLIAKGFKSLGLKFNEQAVSVSVKIRYNAPDVPAVASRIDDETVRIDFKTSQEAVTPGQSVVFFDGDIVLGGAVIEQSL